MPRDAETLRKMREASRERILMGALHVFARRGYAGGTVREIAEEAGVSLGLIYNYFQGKEDLLRAIFESTLQQVEESFVRAGRGATPEERLSELVRGAFEIVRDNLEFWRLAYQVRLQPEVVEGLRESVRTASESIRLEIERLLREAGAPSPETEALVVFAAIDGVAQHYALDPEGYRLGEAADALVGLVTRRIQEDPTEEEES